LFERALRKVSGKPIALPYWDWTSEASTKAVFADDFMGGTGDPAQDFAVTTGPFRKGQWELEVAPAGSEAASQQPFITRNLGSPPFATKPSKDDLNRVLATPVYDTAPFGLDSDPGSSMRNALEGWVPGTARMVCTASGTMEVQFTDPPPAFLHNSVHSWVGGFVGAQPDGRPLVGTMLQISTSPNDPTFFLNHAMVDRVWSKWQDLHPSKRYEPQVGLPGNSGNDLMTPFVAYGYGVTPNMVQETRSLGYEYR
jgi:tyrosinase